MGIFGLAAPLWIATVAVLLFCALLIVRFTFGLVREVKGLGKGIRRTNERLQAALGEVRDESRRASETMGRISARRGKRR